MGVGTRRKRPGRCCRYTSLVGKAAQQVPATERPPRGLHKMPSDYSRGPCNLTEKGHSGQSGQHGLRPHFPNLSRPRSLAPTKFHRTICRTLPSAVAGCHPQRQPVWPYPLAGACLPLHTAQRATPWILPNTAEHPPTLILSHPLCLRNFARMGHSSSGWRGQAHIRRVGGAWMLHVSGSPWILKLVVSVGKPHPCFCPGPTCPCLRLGPEGESISDTNTSSCSVHRSN